MNYIKLINTFYDRLETNSLSTSAIALWHALVHINNKAGWQREFSVAVSVLCVKTGLSARSITTARNELKQKGYIDFKSRRGNKSAIYSLVDLSESIARNHADNKPLSEINADSHSDTRSRNYSDSRSGNSSALNKLNETKQNDLYINTGGDNLLKIINDLDIRCRGIHDLEELESYLGLMDRELVIEALKRSQGKSVPYAVAILEDWKTKGVFAASQLKGGAINASSRQHDTGHSGTHKPITGGKTGWLNRPTGSDV